MVTKVARSGMCLVVVVHDKTRAVACGLWLACVITIEVIYTVPTKLTVRLETSLLPSTFTSLWAMNYHVDYKATTTGKCDLRSTHEGTEGQNWYAFFSQNFSTLLFSVIIKLIIIKSCTISKRRRKRGRKREKAGFSWYQKKRTMITNMWLGCG